MTATPLPLTSVLAWTPIFEPAPGVAQWWWALSIPMAFFLAMAYKATRVTDITDFWRSTIKMTLQILASMVGIAVGLALLIQVLLPMLPAE